MTPGAAPAATLEAPVESRGRDALAFLRRILPKTGYYVAARPAGKGFKHTVCASLEDLVARVLADDAQGKTSYHACGSFRERSVDSAPDKDGRTHKQVRVHANVRALRSFYLDIDVAPSNPAKYESQEAALDALVDFCAATSLPIPMVISSGRGLHCYVPLKEEVAPDAWRQTATALKALAAKLGFRADPACTSDPARILRTVGTYNRKDPANLRPVELVADAPDIAYGEFHEKVMAALQQHGVTPPKPVLLYDATKARLNEAFGIQQNFPPCSAKKVADRCPQLALMRDTRGCVSEPLWFASIQLICHSIEGDELAHAWSNGYAGYSREETDRKIQQVRSQGIGPTLCTTFESRNPGGCDACPFKGKISSPVQLGVASLDIPTVPAAPTLSEPVSLPSPQPGGEIARGFGALAVPAGQDPITQALMELNSQYAWAEKQKQIFRFHHQDFIEPATFKIALANRPPVQVVVGNKDPKSVPLADAWLRWPARREHLDIVYEPGKDPVFDNCINLWPGWGCEPIAGDITPWQRLLDEAFGRETLERTWFEQWVAYPIQHPGTKLFTAVMLWGAAQGLGKSLIGQTIGKIYGKNYREIDNDALDKPFNAWVKGKQFILGEELTSGDRRAIMTRLKHLITGETIALEEKWQPEIVLRNTINFMFTSNNPDALHIDINDRRMCVIEFAGGKLPKEFFDDLIRWRDERGGTSALLYHLLRLPLMGFSPTAEAPRTRAKDEMMDATFSDIERWLFERYLDPRATPAAEVVYAGDLAGQYLGQKGHHVSETAVGRALTRLGSRAKKRVAFSDARKQLHAIRRPQHWAGADERAWATEYEKGRTIGALARASGAQFPAATVPPLRHGPN